MADLCGLAKAFFGSETAIHLVALTEDAREVPATLSVKKNLEKANKLSRLKEVALSHPMVAAALEIFGGEIADIDKAEEINNK